jgi:hypothetical protein
MTGRNNTEHAIAVRNPRGTDFIKVGLHILITTRDFTKKFMKSRIEKSIFRRNLTRIRWNVHCSTFW